MTTISKGMIMQTITEPIEVTFPLDRFDALGNEVLCNVELLKRLREAGIPAVGRISLQGVEYGTLSYHRDRLFGDAVYRWVPESPEDDDDDDHGL